VEDRRDEIYPLLTDEGEYQKVRNMNRHTDVQTDSTAIQTITSAQKSFYLGTRFKELGEKSVFSKWTKIVADAKTAVD